MKRLIFLALGTALTLVLIAEAVLRFQFGLASPPLYVAHPTIEYLPRPNQDLQFFGKQQVYNQQGMRSRPLEEAGYDRLVLVLGDSLINGGNTLGQSELATTQASAPISGQPNTLFANVSAKSWGPENLVGWVEEYGFLDADTVVFVFSSHDITDNPTFEPLDPRAHPTQPPSLALEFVLTRVLDRLIPRPATAVAQEVDAVEAEDRGRNGMNLLIDKAAAAGLKLCLVQHQTKSELASQPLDGYQKIKTIFEQRGIPSIDFGSAITGRDDMAQDPFIDDIHINAFGQSLLAPVLQQCADVAAPPS